MNKEIRSLEFDIQAQDRDDADRRGRITGTPIVFDQVTDLGWYQETIARGALDNCDLRDVRFLVGHNTSGIPLARSRNNNGSSTMQLSVTERGMEIRVDLDIDGNPEAKSLYSAIKRGDITGMSFAFVVDKERWDDIDTNCPKRTILSIRKVFEVSAVTFPAYEGTDIQAASEGDPLDSVRASLESARKQAEEDRARETSQERRRALMEWLSKYEQEEKSDV